MRAIGWPRPTVRLRLTLTYTALLVVAGASMLAVSYTLVRKRENGPGTAVAIICHNSVGLPQGSASGVVTGTGPGPPVLNKADCPDAVGTYYRSFGRGGSGATVGPAPGGVVGVGGPAAVQIRQLTDTIKASQVHTLDSFKLESAIALGIVTILSLGLSWWMAGRALQPVHRITDAARTLSERTLNARINLRGPNDELKQLADTFDAMLGRLERSFHSQRRFVANASHELRTPLATERVLIDEALADRSAGPAELRSILEQLRANSEDTERIIDALLVLARSERGLERWSPVELPAVVGSVVEQAAVEAAGADVRLESDLRPVSVSGDAGLLERLVANLVENAIRYNVTGGTVSVTTAQEAGAAVLGVVNTGPVVPAGAVARLVEPFRRAGPDRSANDGGVGLGLSIVDAIVTTHQGRLHLGARPEGGLDVRVELPLGGAGLSGPGQGAVAARPRDGSGLLTTTAP